MKVCHIINSLNRGGAETHLLDLCKVQLSNGLDVEIVSIGKDKVNIFDLVDIFDPNDLNNILYKHYLERKGFYIKRKYPYKEIKINL